MPIYEYKASVPARACAKCREGFEVIQGIHEKPLSSCPQCGKKVGKVISRCHAAVIENEEGHVRTKRQIRSFEKSGMWSHAAELADKHSEKTKDKGLKLRALDNYKKAGYDADSLSRHIKNND
jgi:putative FmdB family regulatory protein